MTILTVFLLVALVIVAWRRQQSPTRALTALLAVLAVASLSSAVVVWQRPQREVARQIARIERVHEAMGFALGRAVAQAIPQGGNVLVLLPGLPAKFPKSGVGAAQVKGLRAGFGRDNLQAVPVGYTPASADEAQDIQNDWPLRGIPFAKINEWFVARRGAVAVVAFTAVGTGLNWLPQTQIPPLFASGTPILSIGDQALWLDWVKSGGLEAVVVSPNGFDWATAAAPNSLPEVFEKCCELITPNNVAAAKSRMGGGKP